MFENLTGRLSEAARALSGKGRLTEANIKDTLRQVRLALLEAGMGVTYLSDRVLGETDGLHPVTGLEISTMTRDVGLYYKKHKALSEGAKRFIAICQTRFAEGA